MDMKLLVICLFVLIAGSAFAARKVSGPTTTWPEDADGKVFRLLQQQGFDFTKSYLVDFNVDFDKWPPSEEAIKALKEKYSEIKVNPPEGGDNGHFRFQINHQLSYEWVLEVQRTVSEMMRPFGGRCESWGVMGKK